MADLRAGLIGLGMMGRHHARVLRSLPGVQLVAVADPAGDPHGVANGLPVGSSVEDLIAAALNDARAKADQAANSEMQKVTSGLPLPPGMKLPF